MRKKYVAVMFIMVTLLIAWLPHEVQAGVLEFSVKNHYPENQKDKNASYFDIQTKPGEKQILEVEINNPTTHNLTVQGLIKTATTNSLGVIEYGESLTTLDDTAPLNLEEIVTLLEPEKEIPAKSNEIYKIEIAMPDKAFDGVLVGGITYSQKEDEGDETDKNAAAGVNNKFVYTHAIVLHGENPIEKPELKLISVDSGLEDNKNAFLAKLQNPLAFVMRNFTLSAEVRKAGQQEVLYETKLEEGKIAPNTTLNLPIYLNGAKFVAGDYDLTINASADGGEWTFNDTVTVTKEAANKANKESVDIVPPDYTYLYWGLGIASVLIILLIILFIFRNKKKKAAAKKRKNRKKSKTKSKKKKDGQKTSKRTN